MIRKLQNWYNVDSDLESESSDSIGWTDNFVW